MIHPRDGTLPPTDNKPFGDENKIIAPVQQLDADVLP
jgi:hypothetical protein